MPPSATGRSRAGQPMAHGPRRGPRSGRVPWGVGHCLCPAWVCALRLTLGDPVRADPPRRPRRGYALQHCAPTRGQLPNACSVERDPGAVHDLSGANPTVAATAPRLVHGERPLAPESEHPSRARPRRAKQRARGGGRPRGAPRAGRAGAESRRRDDPGREQR